jgi:putative oxidoreductase
MNLITKIEAVAGFRLKTCFWVLDPSTGIWWASRERIPGHPVEEMVVLKRLLRTDKGVSSLILRVMLAVVFFPHGAQKVFGWFGGPGFGATLLMFTNKAGIPLVLAFLAILAESLGPLALIAGFFTRLAAFGLAVNMVVCALMNHVKNGFFMNWFGNQKGEGFEYHILVVAIGIALMIKGGGKWSLDGFMAGQRKIGDLTD